MKKFKGTYYDEKIGNQENCSWYKMNINLAIAAIASGIGPSDMEKILNFLHILLPKSFPYQTFTKIANLQGKSLDKIANKSMEKSLFEEIQKETGQT